MSIASDIQKRIKANVKMSCLGNSSRSMKDLAIDLVNESKQDWSKIAEGCYLHTTTIRNLVEEKTKNPQSETLERIFKYFGVKFTSDLEPIKAKYANLPKE